MVRFISLLIASFILFTNANSNSDLPDCKGNNYSNWTNCYGEFTASFDEKLNYTYKGEFGSVPGKWEGLGLYFFTTKEGKEVSRYEGQVSNGREFGFGIYTESNGFKQISQKDEKGVGFSKTYYPEGDYYIGQTKRGARHGKGMQTTKGKKTEVYAIFKDDHMTTDIPMKEVAAFEEEVLIFEATLKAFEECQSYGIKITSKEFDKCSKQNMQYFTTELNEERITKIREFDNKSKKGKRQLFSSADGTLKECVSYTISGACVKRIPYVKKKKTSSSSSYDNNSYSGNNQAKLYYDSKSGGMRECNHDPGITGKCLMFKPYNASAYDSNTLFYNPSNGSMQPCIGIITPLGKCTAFGLYTSGSASKGQLFYNSKEDKMTTCKHVTVSGKCAHYDIVANNYSNNNSFKMSSSANPYYKKVPRTSDQLISLGLNMLSGGCTLGLNC